MELIEVSYSIGDQRNPTPSDAVFESFTDAEDAAKAKSADDQVWCVWSMEGTIECLVYQGLSYF